MGARMSERMFVCLECGATYPRAQEHCGLDGKKLVEGREFPLLGRVVDRYQIEAVLGMGGMATVYRARHLKLDQSYALKALHGPMASDVQLARRFQREARVLSRLSHPHIVQVTDFGSTEHGLLYMVMEYLSGEPLWERVRRDGPLSPARAARLLHQTCSALAKAHRGGFVHRDLKPQNLMWMPPEDPADGETVKVLDFGLVGLLEPNVHGHTQLTAQGMFLGTPAYMAPEQVTGGAVGPQTDLYALGVVAFWMLTGEPPFRGDARELAHQHVTTPPPRPRLEYGGLTPIVLRLLEKDPESRFSDARKLATAIQETGLLERGGGTAAPSLDLDSDPELPGPSPGRDASSVEALRSEPALVIPDPTEVASSERGLRRPRRSWSRASLAVLVLAGLAGGLFALDRWRNRPKVEPADTALNEQGARSEDAPKEDRPPENSAFASNESPRGKSDQTAADDSRARPSTGGERSEHSGSKRPPADGSRGESSDEANVAKGTSPPSPAEFRRAFQEADQALTEHLAALNVGFARVQAAEPSAAAQWGRWYRGRQTATVAELAEVANTLKNRATAIAQARAGDSSGTNEGAREAGDGADETALDRSLEKIIAPEDS